MTAVESFGVSASDWWGLTWRLVLATLVGGATGLERQTAGKAAGLRTHMLVSLGSAFFIVIPLVAGIESHSDVVSRVIQGIATGVGFLGAGEIIHQSRTESRRPQIKGLTSAAAIWATAALGIIAGCGLWQASVIGTLLTLLILRGAKRAEKYLPVNRDEEEE